MMNTCDDAAAAAQKTAMNIMEANMSHNHEFPVLYAKDKNGKMKSWSADVFTHSNVLCNQAIQRIMYGYIDGKQQISYRDYNEGKNIGKKNETTPLMQCISETQRKWLDKKEKEGYSETKPVAASAASAVPCDESPIILPMLAQTYNPGSLVSKKHNIVFPCFVQPKLDGLRCVTYITQTNDSSKSGSSVNPNGTHQYRVIHQSRTGATFEGLAHITESVAGYLAANPNIVLDGELYTDEMPFEELVGIIKRKKIDDEALLRLAKVKYHIYDILDKTKLQMPYTERLRKCVEAVNGCIAVHTNGNTGEIKPVVMVRTIEVKDIPDFKKWFAVFIEDGYEGIMLRNKLGVYRTNYRSNDLQKYKEFVEDEYKIVGYTQADGRDKGTVIWNCITSDGKEFSVRPRGTMQMRRDWFNNGEKYIGKKLTVIYQELTDDGKPRFPVGKAIRDGY